MFALEQQVWSKREGDYGDWPYGYNEKLWFGNEFLEIQQILAQRFKSSCWALL